MTLIIGIDPGSRHTGYGLIRQQGGTLSLVECGTISTVAEDMPSRLGQIFSRLNTVVQTHGPAEAAVEKVFMAKNADSALKLGQARGAALCALVQNAVLVSEYSARQVKQALVGKGSAEKTQVAQMVRYLLKLDYVPQADAADALGLAICHAHMRVSLARLQGATAVRGRRVR
ncbi:MAG: crossover junction endodeoxyribonuclease RuvC [Gammaproteobacteria bacterium HGW-Gammaproteobacteria-14]|nr:MAG: crossover junction endodeoxyribonuclease RuvC [Gammaproteobacteria bacterium HGW-Gammaproteobacteria-14]